MKKGTFIIIERDGRQIAAVRRADSGIIELPELSVTLDLHRLNGQACEYLFKGDKIVKVGGRNIFQANKAEQPKLQRSLTPVQADWKRAVRESVKEDEPENIENRLKPNIPDSFELSKARVPNDTRRVNVSKLEIDNFSLKLNQFARYHEWVSDVKNGQKTLDRKFFFFNPRVVKDKQDERRNIGKMNIFVNQRGEKNFGNLFSKSNTQLADRQKAAAKSIFPKDGHLMAQKFKPDWRFVTGLGGHSVYETGLTLHHVYGIPYIPASSVKGVLRSWVIFSVFGKNEQGEEEMKNAEKRALACADFCHVFGCPNESELGKAHQGKVTFFDALPTTPPKIEPDIMNSHYPKWYGGTGAPVDTDSPNPVFFLTVVDTTFEFLLGSKKRNLQTETFWGKTLGEWLSEALCEHGIGAKTAVGYGYMHPEKD